MTTRPAPADTEVVTPTTAIFPYPAKVAGPDGELYMLARLGVRFAVGKLWLRVFVAQPNTAAGKVVLADEFRIERVVQRIHPLAPRRVEWFVTDEDGGVWTVTRSTERGCCGHPLLRFQPDRWNYGA